MGPLAALAFLTRIPLTRGRAYTLDQVARAQAWFPAVGLALGGLLVGLDRLAMRGLPDTSVDAIVVVALVVLTGALHLDGLADAADGLLGGGTPERRLEIMRDVHAGTYAIVAVACVLALKWAGLAALPPGIRVEALLLVPSLARLGMVVSIATFPYARPEGLGAAFHDRARPLAAAAGATTAVLATVALLGPGGLYAVGAAVAVALGCGVLATRMTGGMTGDLYGATVEIEEAALLLFIAAFANRGWLDAWVLQ
jgi:adenosylcobinamide-GDP ribazoletransferase